MPHYFIFKFCMSLKINKEHLIAFETTQTQLLFLDYHKSFKKVVDDRIEEKKKSQIIDEVLLEGLENTAPDIPLLRPEKNVQIVSRSANKVSRYKKKKLKEQLRIILSSKLKREKRLKRKGLIPVATPKTKKRRKNIEIIMAPIAPIEQAAIEAEIIKPLKERKVKLNKEKLEKKIDKKNKQPKREKVVKPKKEKVRSPKKEKIKVEPVKKRSYTRKKKV